MKIDLILHGVPNGHDLWGGEDDSQYFSALYNNVSTQEMRESLMIETRQIASKTYCYYNYLKYNNVLSSEGRAGSYIGITIRMDAFCKDILSIYNLCEILYKKLNGINFETRGDTTSFIVPKFELKNNILNDMQSAIVDWFRMSAIQSDFERINSRYRVQNGSIKKLCLVDSTSENVLNALSQFSRVYISKYYHTLSAILEIRRIEELHRSALQQKDEDYSRLNIKYNDVSREKEQLSSENIELQSVLAQRNKELEIGKDKLEKYDELNRRVKELDAQVKQNRTNKRVEELILKIEDPLRTLAQIASQSCNTPYVETLENTNRKRTPKVNKKKKLMFSFLVTLSLSLVIFLLCQFMFVSSDSSPKEKVKTEQVDKNKTEKDDVKPEEIINE